MTTIEQNPLPRIYVACLASYNSGVLHGAWIDATQGPDHMQDAIQEMLQQSPEPGAEEWAIHDYDGFPARIADQLGESPSLELVATLAELIEEHGETFAAWYADGRGDGLEPYELAELYSDQYMGSYGSPEEWAEEHLTDTGQLDGLAEHLRPYFDCEAYALDARLSGDVWFAQLPSGGVAVFRNY